MLMKQWFSLYAEAFEIKLEVVGCYSNSTIDWNYFGQSFTMAKLEDFRTYASPDRPPL